jgi:hypothetical protein
VREALEVGREFVIEGAMLRSTEKDPVRAALALCSGDFEIDSIIDGLDQAGYVIVPKEATRKMVRALSEKDNSCDIRESWRVMVKAWTEDR